MAPPCAVTLTVVLGATELEPLAGVIARLTAPLEVEEEDDELEELDPSPDGLCALASF